MKTPANVYICDFCHKTNEVVKVMVTEPETDAAICNECVLKATEAMIQKTQTF